MNVVYPFVNRTLKYESPSIMSTAVKSRGDRPQTKIVRKSCGRPGNATFGPQAVGTSGGSSSSCHTSAVSAYPSSSSSGDEAAAVSATMSSPATSDARKPSRPSMWWSAEVNVEASRVTVECFAWSTTISSSLVSPNVAVAHAGGGAPSGAGAGASILSSRKSNTSCCPPGSTRQTSKRLSTRFVKVSARTRSTVLVPKLLIPFNNSSDCAYSS